MGCPWWQHFVGFLDSLSHHTRGSGRSELSSMVLSCWLGLNNHRSGDVSFNTLMFPVLWNSHLSFPAHFHVSAVLCCGGTSMPASMSAHNCPLAFPRHLTPLLSFLSLGSNLCAALLSGCWFSLNFQWWNYLWWLLSNFYSGLKVSSNLLLPQLCQ